jgi:hypothetical protein
MGRPRFERVTLHRALLISGAAIPILLFACEDPGQPTPSYLLSIEGQGSGSGTVRNSQGTIDCRIEGDTESGTCEGTLQQNTVVELLATADDGSTLGEWTGPCSGDAPVCVVTMDRARTASVTFTALRTLTVSLNGTGSGGVSSIPPGISCTLAGGVTSGSCSTTVMHGQIIVLTPTPSPNHTFAGWSGACTGSGACEISMDQAHLVSATFTQPALQALTITLEGSGSGNVESTPAGIDCLIERGATSGICSASFPFGTILELTAAARSDHTFSGWAGACSGISICRVTMDQGRSVVATFAGPSPQALTVTTAGAGGAELLVYPRR